MNFSNRFRDLMDSSGKTQKELATALELSEGAMINYKRDSVPKSMELYRIARFFNVSMEWLLTGAGPGTAIGDSAWRQRAMSAEQRLDALKSALGTLLKKY